MSQHRIVEFGDGVGIRDGQRKAPAEHWDFEGSQHAVGVEEGHIVPPHCVPFWAKDADNATRRLRKRSMAGSDSRLEIFFLFQFLGESNMGAPGFCEFARSRSTCCIRINPTIK